MLAREGGGGGGALQSLVRGLCKCQLDLSSLPPT